MNRTGERQGCDAAVHPHGRKQTLVKHARDLTAHTTDGCDLLRLAEVGMVAHMIRATSRDAVTDEERETFDGWMDARRCFHVTTLAMTDDPLTLFDSEVFASTLHGLQEIDCALYRRAQEVPGLSSAICKETCLLANHASSMSTPASPPGTSS